MRATIQVFSFTLVVLFGAPSLAQTIEELREIALRTDYGAPIPSIQVGVEYYLNGCELVRVSSDSICVPTENGGFIIMPISIGYTVEELSGAQIGIGGTIEGYVSGEDDLVGVPLQIQQLIRGVGGIAGGSTYAVAQGETLRAPASIETIQETLECEDNRLFVVLRDGDFEQVCY